MVNDPRLTPDAYMTCAIRYFNDKWCKQYLYSKACTPKDIARKVRDLPDSRQFAGGCRLTPYLRLQVQWSLYASIKHVFVCVLMCIDVVNASRYVAKAMDELKMSKLMITDILKRV
jgi:hypothetical protein